MHIHAEVIFPNLRVLLFQRSSDFMIAYSAPDMACISAVGPDEDHALLLFKRAVEIAARGLIHHPAWKSQTRGVTHETV